MQYVCSMCRYQTKGGAKGGGGGEGRGGGGGGGEAQRGRQQEAVGIAVVKQGGQDKALQELAQTLELKFADQEL